MIFQKLLTGLLYIQWCGLRHHTESGVETRHAQWILPQKGRLCQNYSFPEHDQKDARYDTFCDISWVICQQDINALVYLTRPCSPLSLNSLSLHVFQKLLRDRRIFNDLTKEHASVLNCKSLKVSIATGIASTCSVCQQPDMWCMTRCPTILFLGGHVMRQGRYTVNLNY